MRHLKVISAHVKLRHMNPIPDSPLKRRFTTVYNGETVTIWSCLSTFRSLVTCVTLKCVQAWF